MVLHGEAGSRSYLYGDLKEKKKLIILVGVCTQRTGVDDEEGIIFVVSTSSFAIAVARARRLRPGHTKNCRR